MAFFDNLKDKASDAAVVAGKAVNEMYEATKLRMAIAEKKGTLKALYREMGEMVYHSYKNSDAVTDEMEDKIAEIDSVHEEIAALNAQQMKIKKVRTCSGCGSEIPVECNFCPKCGKEAASEEFEAEVVKEDEETEVASEEE